MSTGLPITKGRLQYADHLVCGAHVLPKAPPWSLKRDKWTRNRSHLRTRQPLCQLGQGSRASPSASSKRLFAYILQRTSLTAASSQRISRIPLGLNSAALVSAIAVPTCKVFLGSARRFPAASGLWPLLCLCLPYFPIVRCLRFHVGLLPVGKLRCLPASFQAPGPGQPNIRSGETS
jgi:hypothetical protein